VTNNNKLTDASRKHSRTNKPHNVSHVHAGF